MLRKFQSGLVIGLIAIAFFYLIYIPALISSHTEIFYDRLQRYFHSQSIHDDRIVVVGMKDASLKDDWENHQQVLTQIIQDGARVIGLHFFMSQSPFDHSALLAEINSFQSLVLPIFYDTTQTLTGQAIIKPYKGRLTSNHVGNITISSSADGLTRQITPLIHEKGRAYPPFSVVLARLALSSLPNSQPHINGQRLIWDDLKIPLDQYGKIRINYRDFETNYPILSYEDVLNEQIPTGTFKDKIVLIGQTDLLSGHNNLIRTPLHGPPYFGVVFQAQVLSNFLNQRSIGFIPYWLMHLLVILFAFGSALSFNQVRDPIKRMGLFIVFFLILFSLAISAFFIFQRNLPAFELFIMLVLSFFLNTNQIMAKTNAKLRQSNTELLELNTTLEDKVNERTAILKKTNEELKHLQQMKEELTKMVIHDLKNPLTSIMGNLELFIALYSKDMDHEPLELIEMAHTNSERLRFMIQNMMDISKMENKKLELQNELINLVDLIQETMTDFQALAKKDGKKLLYASQEQGAVVWADRYLIQRVIYNLLTNAFKYTNSGDHIQLELLKQADNILIKVTDSGLGIPEEFHQQIFEKFEQVGLKTHQRQMSTGLGLAFCKMVIELHQGIIWVESQPNQGSSFIIQMALVEEDFQNMFLKEEPNESYSHRG